jgi:hypothetical protein
MPPTQALVLATPKLKKLGPVQRIERSPEYGLRPFWRQLYRVDERLLRGTALEGRSSREKDDFFRQQTKDWEQREHQRMVFTILDNHDYQVDVLDDFEPIPDRVSFRTGYAPKRAELRDSLGLVIGLTNGGETLTSNADAWPHAIIGGSSGCGKSVFVASLLGQVADKPPTLVRLALGDLAGADLGPFSRLPHAIAPLADDLSSVLALFQQVESELNARQAFLTRPFSIKRPDGSTNEIEDGVPNLDVWNDLVVKLGRPDLALPRVLVVVDEWKQAMDGSDEAMELAALAARVMRVGRKWGGRVWLIAQEPKKGTGKDVTFPSDILANADSRIVLAKGGNPLLWRLMLGDAASFDADKPRLIGTQGDIVQGRGVFHAAGEDTIFQGLFISRDHDADDLSSELTRHVRAASKHAVLPVEARLLGERSYAPTGRILRVVVDPQLPGDEAVQLEMAPAPVKPKTDYEAIRNLPAKDDLPSLSGRYSDPVAPGPSPFASPFASPLSPPFVAPARDPYQINDDKSPRLPTQAETRCMEPMTALRYLYRAEDASQSEGTGTIDVSRSKLREMIRAETRVAPGALQLSNVLRLLRNRGLLVEDGRFSQLAYGSWAEAREALEQGAVDESKDDVEPADSEGSTDEEDLDESDDLD